MSEATLSSAVFAATDRIQVVDPPLRFRAGPGLNAEILEELAAGVELCVTGGPQDADGFTWYPVRRADGGREGWVAGAFCGLVETGGCVEAADPVVDEDNWPTAAAIDARIALSNAANGRTSKLTGMGAAFVTLGRRYGINPGIVCAISQRECQLGADGSRLPTEFNNFAGLTAGRNAEFPGTCGAEFFIDRFWKRFCSPEEGLEGMFRLLDTALYRNTGGRLWDVMMLYSPPGDGNPWPPEEPNIFTTFRAVGQQLGIVIDFDTQIFTAP